jgi:hypothetical protein
MTTFGGRLGTPQILATTDLTTVYTTPTGFAAIATLSLTNRTVEALKIRVATSDSADPADAEFIEWDTVMTPRAVFERTQIVLQPGRRILVSTDTINAIAVTVYGLLTSTNVDFEGVEEVLIEQGDASEPVSTSELDFSAATVVQGQSFDITLTSSDYDADSTLFFDNRSALSDGVKLTSTGPNILGQYFAPDSDRKVMQIDTLDTHRNSTETIEFTLSGVSYSVNTTPTTANGTPSFSTGITLNSTDITGFTNVSMINGVDDWKNIMRSLECPDQLSVLLPATVTAPFTIEFYGKINSYTQPTFALPLFCSLSNSTNGGAGLTYGGASGYNGGGVFSSSPTDHWTWTVLSVDANWVGTYWRPGYVWNNDLGKYQNVYVKESANINNATDQTVFDRMRLLTHNSSDVSSFRSQATVIDYHTVRISSIDRYPATLPTNQPLTTFPDPYAIEADADTVALFRFSNS